MCFQVIVFHKYIQWAAVAQREVEALLVVWVIVRVLGYSVIVVIVRVSVGVRVKVDKACQLCSGQGWGYENVIV